jgi:hypothetical protein
VYLTVLVPQLISTSVFSVFGAVFSFYLLTVLARVRKCTFTCSCGRNVHVFSHVYDCTSVHVIARVRNCIFIHVFARVRYYTCICSCARLYSRVRLYLYTLMYIQLYLYLDIRWAVLTCPSLYLCCCVCALYATVLDHYTECSELASCHRFVLRAGP